MAIARVKDSGNKQAGPVGFQAGSMPKVIKSQVLQHEDDSQKWELSESVAEGTQA